MDKKVNVIPNFLDKSKVKYLVYKKTTYGKYGKQAKTGHGILDLENDILFLSTGKRHYVNGVEKEIYRPIFDASKKFLPIVGKPDQFKGVTYDIVERYVPIEKRGDPFLKSKVVVSEHDVVEMKRTKHKVKTDKDISLLDRRGKRVIYTPVRSTPQKLSNSISFNTRKKSVNSYEKVTYEKSDYIWFKIKS